MDGQVRVHGTNDTDIVNALPDVVENLTHLDSALSISAEFEGGTQEVARRPFGGRVPAGEGLAMILIQRRLGIEGVNLGEAAVQKKEDHVLGAGWEMSGPGSRSMPGNSR